MESTNLYYDEKGRPYIIKDGRVYYVTTNIPTKKKGIVNRLKNWFDGLSVNQQLGILCGTWFVAGLSWGSLISDVSNAKRQQKVTNLAYDVGTLQGRSDAYKEMAMNNPFNNLTVKETGKF